MDKCPNTCLTCLCNDRKLDPLEELRNVLKYIQFTKLKSVYGGICWECKNTIMKFYRLKKKAIQVQSNLSLKKVKNLKPLSNLGIKVNIPYNYHYNYDDSPHIEDNSQNEIQIKVENFDNDNSEIDNSCNLPVIVNVKTEIEPTQRILEISPLPCSSDSHDVEKQLNDIRKEHSNKFIKLIRSEKQMLKHREDLKNSYDYENILFMPFKCHFCVHGFETRKSYEEHLHKSHDESIGTYTCHVCNVRFESIVKLEAHRQIHYVYYKCRLCKYTSSQECVMLNHCKVLHENDCGPSLFCQQCQAVLGDELALEEHMNMEHYLTCNLCDLTFINRYSLKKHRSETHTSEFVCDICKHAFTAKSRLETHMAKHSALLEKKMSYCSECKVQFKSLNAYRNHIRTSANHAKSSFSCSKCEKVFPSEAYLKRHYNYVHVRDAKHFCAPCEKAFMLPFQLKNHNKIHHEMPRARDHACNVCGKKFFTKLLLRSHLVTHSEKRPHTCTQCGDTFKQRSSLYNHIRLIHKGEKKNKSCATVPL